MYYMFHKLVKGSGVVQHLKILDLDVSYFHNIVSGDDIVLGRSGKI